MEEESSKKYQLKFDKKEIIEKIKQTGKYESGDAKIIKWEDDMNTDTEMYIIKNKLYKYPFIGVVNYEFKREGYCVNTYQNGDEYFGYYSNDLRNKQGLYIYQPKQIINKSITRQYYFGLWENDRKHGRGIYIWLKDNSTNLYKKAYNPFNDFDNSSFNAYVGEFEYDNFTKGTLLKKEGENYFVFHGNLDSKTLKKNGKECFYYSAKLEQIFYGTFRNDIFIEGYIGKFNENGDIDSIAKYQNKKIIKKDNSKEFNNNKIISKKIQTFRNVIMSKDYFGDLYNIFQDIINFKNENMNDINIFNSDKYLDLMEIGTSYNQVSIFKDVEKYINQ